MATYTIDKIEYDGNTYNLQDNTSGYGTGTITGVTAGTGLTGGGNSGSVTVNHSNSVTAQNTQAVYPIKIDAQGHISSYGSAVSFSNTTYSISMSNNVITLTGSDSSTSTVTLPVYDETVLDHAEGESF